MQVGSYESYQSELTTKHKAKSITTTSSNKADASPHEDNTGVVVRNPMPVDGGGGGGGGARGTEHEEDEEASIICNGPSLVYSEQIDWSKVKHLLCSPTVVLILLQGVPGCVPWGIFYVYLNDYLSENKGFSVEEATVIVTMFGLGGLVGQWLGGWAGQRLYNMDKRYQIYLMGVSTITATLPLLVLINTDKQPDQGSFPFLCAIGLVSGILVLMNGPNINVVLQNACAPETRGTGFALFTLTNDVGRGGGPLVVAYMISLLGGRENAFNAAFVMLIPCGLMILSISWTVVAGEAAVQEGVSAAIARGFRPVRLSDVSELSV
jgi:hypothetical protein